MRIRAYPWCSSTWKGLTHQFQYSAFIVRCSLNPDDFSRRATGHTKIPVINRISTRKIAGRVSALGSRVGWRRTGLVGIWWRDRRSGVLDSFMRTCLTQSNLSSSADTRVSNVGARRTWPHVSAAIVIRCSTSPPSNYSQTIAKKIDRQTNRKFVILFDILRQIKIDKTTSKWFDVTVTRWAQTSSIILYTELCFQDFVLLWNSLTFKHIKTLQLKMKC